MIVNILLLLFIIYNINAALPMSAEDEFRYNSLRAQLKLDKRNERSWTELAMLYTQYDRVYEAEKCARRALQINPDNEVGNNIIGVSLIRQGHSEEAFFHLEKLARVNPDNYANSYNLAVLCNDMDRIHDAEKWLRLSINMKPRGVDILDVLAETLVLQDRIEEAFYVYNSIYNMIPKRDAMVAVHNMDLLSYLIYTRQQQNNKQQDEEEQMMMMISSKNDRYSWPGAFKKFQLSVSKTGMIRDSTNPTNPNLYRGYRVKTHLEPIKEILINNININILTSYQLSRRPIKITGDCISSLQWDTDKWYDSAYLIKKAGKLDVFAQKKHSSFYSFGDSQRRIIKFEKFLDKIQWPKPGKDGYFVINNAKKGHLDEIDITQTTNNWQIFGSQNSESNMTPLSNLADDLSTPQFFPSMETYFGCNLEIGHATIPRNVTFSLRHDVFDRIVVALRGSYDYILIDPSNSMNVYPIGSVVGVQPNGVSQYLASEYEHQRQKVNYSKMTPYLFHEEEYRALYPLFNQTKQLNVHLNRGEMLFIPAGWYYSFVAHDAHMSLNYLYHASTKVVHNRDDDNDHDNNDMEYNEIYMGDENEKNFTWNNWN